MTPEVTSLDNTTPASMEEGQVQEGKWNGRIINMCTLPLGTIGCILGITGAVLYAQVPEGAAHIAGLVCLCVGWPMCCCLGAFPVYTKYADKT